MSNMDERSLHEDSLLLYSTYVAIYLNDNACNSFRDLNVYISDLDKESKKIYRALMRRINAYFECMNKIVDGHFDFISEIFSSLDDIIEDAQQEYEKVLYDIYLDVDKEQASFLSKLELSKALIAIAVEGNDEITLNLKKMIDKPCGSLNQYRLTEIQRVANNLVKWVLRHYDLTKVPQEKIQLATQKRNELVHILVGRNSFNESYKKAIEQNGLHS